MMSGSSRSLGGDIYVSSYRLLRMRSLPVGLNDFLSGWFRTMLEVVVDR